MKKNFQRFTSLFLVFVTLFNTVISPFTVLADTNTPKKGDLRLTDDNQYTSENGGSVVATEGSYSQSGDVQIRKVVTKLDDNGNYQVKFEARGIRTTQVTQNTAEMYVVVVFDRSNSMTEMGENESKWNSAKNGAKTFASKLNEKFNSSTNQNEKKANIALITFNNGATVKRNFMKNDFTVGNNGRKVNDNRLFGDKPGDDNNGGTNLHAGLIKAYELLSKVQPKEGQEIKKYIVVMGDGAPTYYNNGNNSVKSYGNDTSPTAITKTLDYANTVKASGIEVFTIGYELPSGKVCSDYEEIWNGWGYDYKYRGGCKEAGYDAYKAEDILKKIATDESHFALSNSTNITEAFNNIVEKTSYQPAATNIKIVDNIGSNFTSTDNRVVNRQITLTLDKTTVLEDDSWQAVGEPFIITIDKDSSDWNKTNNNFTYSYTGINGKVEEVSVKNPEVYWVAAKYDYRIEYYYDENIDAALTETGSATKGAEIEVLDTTINDSKHLKDGYKLFKVEPDKKITIKNNGENVIRVHYKKAEFSYRVEYYYNNKIDNSKTETAKALFESEINNYTDKNEEGYKFDKTYNFPLTITSDNNQNIIKVYYITDGSQRKNINYTVEYYKDGVKQEIDTQTKTKDIQVLEPKVLDVDKSSINITDKYYGYKFVGSDPSTIPTTIVDGGVIKIYYEKDLDKIKELNYTVKYYKDGVLQEKDTQVITKKVQVLEPNTLEVNKNNINTVNKYDGYKFDKTNPGEIPTIIENNGVIEVYYVKDEFSYTVEYYYDGTIDDSKTETAKALFESVINNYQDKNKTGYKLDKTKNLPLTITSDSKKNVIKVYYVKDNYGYKVEYYYDNQLDDSMTYTSSAKYLSQVNNYPNGSKKGFSYVSDTAPLTITEKTENNIIKVYYESNVYDYTIYHVEKGNENNILDTVSDSAKYQKEITVAEKEFTGFTYDSKDKEVIKIDTKNNIAYVYYTRNEFNYTIYHVEKGNENNILDVENGNAKYQDEITVAEKEFTGFTYDSKDKKVIKIDTKNNVAYVYYTRNNYDYTIYHVEKGNENNILDTVKGSAKYQEEITVDEKEFTGFTYDSKDADKIIIDVEKNVAYVYYTRNKYNYTVEHYLETKDGKFEIEKTEVVKDVEFETNITYKELEFNGYKYDETLTEAPEKVLEDNLVVRLYYVLADSKVTVHYVVKVDDNYISFDKYGRDELGNNTEEFKDVDLLDEILTGKIGTSFTTKYREVKNYSFIGIYNGNILESSNLEKLEGTNITGEFDFEEQEYTYVYEAPRGGDEVPPQTGFDGSLSYLNYILLVAVIYVLKKYFDLISEK